MKLWQRWKQTAIHNKLLVWTSILVAVGTVFYAGAAAFQIYLMNESSKHTDEQIGRIIENVNWMARSMDWSQKQAQQALNSAIDQSHLDQRAWLEVVPEIFPLKPLSVPQGMERDFPPLFDYRFAIKNTGRSAARIIKVGDNQRQVLNGEDTKVGVENVQKNHLLTRPAPEIMVPGGDNPWVLRGIMRTNNLTPDGKKLMLNQYVGRVDYEDVFGTPHWLTFCYQLHDDATPAMCEFGNSGDTEKPKKR